MGKTLRHRICMAVCCALLLASSAVFAGATGNVTVTLFTIYMSSTATGAYVQFSPANPSGLTGCTYTTGDIVWIDFSATGNPNGRDLYATIVAAALAGKQINIGTQGCGDSGNYPLAYGINVYP